MSARSINPVDKHVAKRIHLLRSMRNMSQAQLARAIGVTFQQIQKYEKGTNRVSGGRLFQIAAALKTDIGFFFEDMPGGEDDALFPPGMSMGEITRLLGPFSSIESAAVRKRVIDLVKAMGEDS